MSTGKVEQFIPEKIPPRTNLETPEILKKTISANKALAELNGISKIIPNEKILINSLVLQEAKDSSEIENIITTHDELYRANIGDIHTTQAAKEVKNYADALLKGYELVKKNALLLKRDIIDIQSILEGNDAGVRRQEGTYLESSKTGQAVYIPPQNYDDIMQLFNDLEKYINTANGLDPLIKMAIIHYQFESIHPFYDGNGRTGRIINILYLVLKKLLDVPILYLSAYIIDTKDKYYSYLQEVRTKKNWHEWVMYVLEGVEVTSRRTIDMIRQIYALMNKTKQEIRKRNSLIYSKDLLEILFSHPYTKIDFLVTELKLHRSTASRYLKKLTEYGFLEVVTLGRSKYFINIKLYELLSKGIRDFK